MWSKPDDGVEWRLLAVVDGLADRGEVGVLEQRTPVPAKSLDVLGSM
jgi:hypothetical protein